MKSVDNAWIQTFTGKKINVFKPRKSDINIMDIAHALSNQCRFSGHCKEFYSVAEHSYHVSKFVSEKVALHGLLHDASEAYMVDVPRPIKPHLTNYKSIEKNLLHVIFDKYHISGNIPKEVKEMDSRMCVTEGYKMMPDISDWELLKTHQPITHFKFYNWTPKEAKEQFINRYLELTE